MKRHRLRITGPPNIVGLAEQRFGRSISWNGMKVSFLEICSTILNAQRNYWFPWPVLSLVSNFSLQPTTAYCLFLVALKHNLQDSGTTGISMCRLFSAFQSSSSCKKRGIRTVSWKSHFPDVWPTEIPRTHQGSTTLQTEQAVSHCLLVEWLSTLD